MSIVIKNKTYKYVSSSRSPYVSFTGCSKGDLVLNIIKTTAEISSIGTNTVLAHTFSSGAERLYFVYIVATEDYGTYSSLYPSITLNATGYHYCVGFQISGAMGLKYDPSMDYSGTYGGNFSVTVTKPSVDTPVIWGIGCGYSLNNTTTNYSASPDDMEYIRCRQSGYALRCSAWADIQTNEVSHTITYPLSTSSYDATVGGMILVPYGHKYVVIDNGTGYVIKNNQLVSLGSLQESDLNANYMIQNGVDSLSGIDAYYSSLTKPVEYSWCDNVFSYSPILTTTVKGVPKPLILTSKNYILDNIVGVSSIAATYTGSPLISFKIDNNDFKYYDSAQSAWVAVDSTHNGMSITDAQALTTEWNSLLNGGDKVKFRVVIPSGSSLKSIVVNFSFV
jgi:hypothetical protein